MAELRAIGLSERQILEKIQKEFGLRTDRSTISNILKTTKIQRMKKLIQDKKYGEVYEYSLIKIFKRLDQCFNLLDKEREMVNIKLNQLSMDMPASKLFEHTDRIDRSVRTQNSIIRNLRETLSELKADTKQVKMTMVEEYQLGMDKLEGLEKRGIIKIIKKATLEKEESE